MDTLPNHGTVHHKPRPGTIHVHLVVWGLTQAEQDKAIDRASQSHWRKAWEFVETERLSGKVCPINLHDGRSIAADTDYGWAYIVYPVRQS